MENVILWGASVAGGVLFVALVWSRLTFGDRTVSPKWEPSAWATNLTGFGAVITLVLGAAAPTVPLTHLTRQEYSTLAATLAATMALAPGILGLVTPLVPKSPVLQRVAFLVGAFFTLSACGAQLLTLRLLVDDYDKAHVIPAVLASGMLFLIAVLRVLVVVYAVVAVHRVLTSSESGAPGPTEKSLIRSDGAIRGVL